MPNLMLTNWCNYRCPYCFGMDMMAPKQKAQSMSKETFLGIMDWLNRKPFDRVIHLMGGEPTLSPHFEWMVDWLLDKEYHITVFSNLATQQAPAYAEKLALLPVHWVVNVNNPVKWNAAQRERITAALASLGTKANLTFNIIPDEPNELWALELIEKYHLNPDIKVGFVLPTLTSSNMALKDSEYALVAERVCNLVKEGERLDVTIELECGVPTCAFTDEQLGFLWRHRSQVKSGCFSRLDITPDGHVMYCLPLATAALKHYTEFESYPDCREWFEERLRPYRLLGNCLECVDCPLNRPDKCHAACVAKNMINAKNVHLTL